MSSACFCSRGWHNRCAGSKNRKCRCKCKGRCHAVKRQPKIDSDKYVKGDKIHLTDMGPLTLREE